MGEGSTMKGMTTTRIISAEVIDRMVDAYLFAAMWASTDEGGRSLDELYVTDDFAPEAWAQARQTCVKFALGAAGAFFTGPPSTDWDQIGHDLWLTRNHHGAGFWDRGYPGDAGERLTQIAQGYGEQIVEVGDDGKLHLLGGEV